MAAICTSEAGVRVITHVPELKRLWLAENHSNVPQIAGIALVTRRLHLSECLFSCLSQKNESHTLISDFSSKK